MQRSKYIGSSALCVLVYGCVRAIISCAVFFFNCLRDYTFIYIYRCKGALALCVYWWAARRDFWFDNFFFSLCTSSYISSCFLRLGDSKKIK